LYTPNHFSVTDRTVQLELIDRYPFGTLTTVSAGRAHNSTVPFLVGADGAIVQEWRKVKVDGHVAEVLEAAKGLGKAAKG